MPSKKPYAEQASINHTIRFTPGLATKIAQLSTRKEFNGNFTAVVITACRQYIATQEDVIGSRNNFQKSFRDRIDELDAKHTQELAQLTQTITQEFGQLYKAIALTRTTTNNTEHAAELAPNDLDTLTLELHTILHLLTFAFSKMLPRFEQADPSVGDPSKLFNNHVTQAQRERNVYDVTIRASQRLLTPTPFTDKDLLPDSK